ncbi:MAG: PAS domain S-box protein [bacterium]|nr:PAS domain S-box protein [bacterium]
MQIVTLLLGISLAGSALALAGALRGARRRIRELEHQVSVASDPKHSKRDARFEAVVEGTNDLIIEIDVTGEISGRYGRPETGWGNQEFADGNVVDLVHPEDRSCAEATLAELTSRRVAPIVDLRGVQPDGSYRWYQIRSAHFYDGEGEARFLVVIRDVNDEKLATAALQENEQRYRSMIDQSPFGVLIVDSALNVVMANKAYADLVGAASPNYLRKHNLFDSPAMQSESTQELIARVVEGERIATELFYTSTFGKRVDVRAHVAPIQDENGNTVAAMLLFEDISTNRLLEDQLRQSQKMEAVGRLAGGIAHDFNNYLTVILGCGEAILEETQPGSDAHEAANQIMQTSERSAALTHKLLAFSRRQVTRSELVDLGEVVARLEPMLRRVLGTGIDFDCMREPQVPMIWADPTLIEQVVMNLAVNARDAMPDGGALQIRVGMSTATVPVGIPAGAGTIELSVQDSGIGMDEETRTHIFEPFFTTKEETGGTGLGLSTVYGIVHQLNGTIHVSSVLGEGSMFRISFPKAKAEEISNKTVAPLPPRETRGNEHILLVEDEAPIRKLARNALTRVGYELLEASNGKAALELAATSQRPIDLLVTDVMMPQMSGTQLAVKLRADRPALRVLFISGYAESSSLPDGDLPKEVDLLKKPFSPRMLLERVRDALDRPEPEDSVSSR